LCAGCSVKPLYNGTPGATSSISIDVIAERDGQILRRHLMDSFRDLGFNQKHRYRLTVTLGVVEKSFAIANDGLARRLLLSYTANVKLSNDKQEAIFEKSIFVSNSSNISNSQGEVIFSLHGRSNGSLLKELSYRIVESIEVFLSNES
jgi:hypothetical protein